MKPLSIPFVGPTYQARSVNADAQLALNCYLEVDDTSKRAPLTLYGTPGTVARFTLADAPVRGMCELDGAGTLAIMVAADGVYVVDAAHTTTLLSRINTLSGQIGMASNGTEVLIVDGRDGWLATSTALLQISDPDFPSGVTRATFQDGFFFVAGDGSGRIYCNETPFDGVFWSGTDFTTAEGAADPTVDVISNSTEVWAFGSKTCEVLISAVTATGEFPLESLPNTFIQMGAIPGTPVKMDSTIYWLGTNDNGQGIVCRAQGYSPVRISNHAMEAEIQRYSTIADAFAYCFQIEGHSFYVLTFPTADATWLYDAATNLWFRWSWRDPASNTNRRHRSNCHLFFGGEHLVGDFQSGKVYALDADTYTDDGDPIVFMRRSQTMNDQDALMFFGQLIVDMETGVGLASGQGSDPMLMLRYSNDGGHTWSGVKTKPMGKAGEYFRRVKFGPTGAGRNRLDRKSVV